MKTRIAAILGFALPLGIVTACSVAGSNAGENKPRKTSASYTLRQGESVELSRGSRLKLERINDSRCRQGAVCVWAGFISYTFALTGPRGSHGFVLAENMPNAAPTATADGLTFALEKLEPPEPPAVDAPAPDYRVTFRVSIAEPGKGAATGP